MILCLSSIQSNLKTVSIPELLIVCLLIIKQCFGLFDELITKELVEIFEQTSKCNMTKDKSLSWGGQLLIWSLHLGSVLIDF